MRPVSVTLALSMQRIGVRPFAEAIFHITGSLNHIRNRVMKRTLKAFMTDAGIVAPGSLNGWTLPDAFWLAECRRSPGLNAYPLGEIAERAFKRTVLWLAIFHDPGGPLSLDADLIAIQNNLRDNIRYHGIEGITSFLLTEFLYEVCRDIQRRPRGASPKSECYEYHFNRNGNPKSLTQERKGKTLLLERCRMVADGINEALVQSLLGDSPACLNERLIRFYRETLGKLPRSSKTRPSRKPPLNVIVGKKSVAGLRRSYAIDPDAVRLDLHDRRGNVGFEYAAIEQGLASLLGEKTVHLHSLSRDLLDICVVVYLADQAVRRENTLERRLDLLMPVRHYSLWNRVKGPLEEILSFLGRDQVTFHFVKKKQTMDPIRFHIESGDRCVSLFSGGLDSAAGALWLLKEKHTPLLVSHHSNPQASGLQRHLFDELKKSHPNFSWMSIFVGKSHKQTRHISHPLGDPPDTVMTQFLRSFLFLGMAAVAAVESHTDTLYIFENGPIALNPMFSEGRVNTRTAHPRFLAAFRNLVASLFQVDLMIANPFLYQTKGEVAEIFANSDCASLVLLTNSCWNWLRVPMWAKKMKIEANERYHQDGTCLPCVVRRASLVHAGLDNHDGMYLFDVFKDYSHFKIPEQVLIADYLRFCMNIEGMGDAELLLEHPDFSVYASDVDLPGLVSMYRRHVYEMLEAFRSQGLPVITKR